MLLQLHNVTCRAMAATDDELHWLAQLLSFQDQSSQFIRRGGKTVFNPNATRQSLFCQMTNSFPAGFTGLVMRQAAKDGLEANLVDARKKPVEPDLSLMPDFLREYQKEAVKVAALTGRGILQMVTGCHAMGQTVVMYDGSLKFVEDVVVGDCLMGPDSSPRRVLRLHRGRQNMHTVTPKRFGAPFTVNTDHVLSLAKSTLKARTCGEPIESVTVGDYPSKGKSWRHLYKLYHTGVISFPDPCDLPIAPYFIGLWLADGTQSLKGVQVTKPDKEVEHYCHEIAAQFGCTVKKQDSNGTRCPTWCLVTPRGKPNPLLTLMRQVFTHGPRRIPTRYKTSSIRDRRQLLAGILDGDGSVSASGYEVTFKQRGLLQDVIFVARSLGMACSEPTAKVVNGTPYYRTHIQPTNDPLPHNIPRKKPASRKINKALGRTGFTIEDHNEEQDYFGFELDRDHLYLLGDFTVTHNSGKTECALALTSVVPVNWLVIAPEKDLMYNMARRYEKRFNDEAGLLGDGITKIIPHFTCATFQTLANKLNDPQVKAFLDNIDGMIVDEVHQAASNSFYSVAQSIDTYWRIGLSGTALKRGDRRNLFTVAAIGNIIHKVGAQELIKLGYLSEAKICMVKYRSSGKATTWQAAETECTIENAGRNRLICQIADELGQAPGLIFVRKKRHGRILEKRLQQRGIRAEFVWGDKNMAQRDDAIRRLENGDLDYIVCSTIFQTGTDIPCLRTLINAGGGRSEIANIQRLGRGLRRTDTKSTVLVFDILDIDDLYMGTPSGNRWNERHSNDRFNSYKREGHSVTVIDLAA